MKIIRVSAIICLLLICFCKVNAQHAPRPLLFDAYASTLDCPPAELEKIFALNNGQAVQLTFSGQTFTGVIGTKKHAYNNLYNVVVKLANLQGAIFHVSKIINPDNSVSYTGRIINEKYGDGYELKQSSGNYPGLTNIPLIQNFSVPL
jgi:hypothetical protein